MILGDSTAVGIGDPLAGGGWRGMGPLLASALEVDRLLNVASTGARMRCVRVAQLPAALVAQPDLAVVVAGMNDTLRSDYSPAAVHADLDAVVAGLAVIGCGVLTVRFHDHSRVFRLPGPLREPLRRRIAELNEVIDSVAATRGVGVVDLDRLPGVYSPAAWSVDRLHPSEIGHRLLAHAFAAEAVRLGWRLAQPVGLSSAGGRPLTTIDHMAWLAGAGVPWLMRRGRDLVPYAVSVAARGLLARRQPEVPQLTQRASQRSHPAQWRLHARRRRGAGHPGCGRRVVAEPPDGQLGDAMVADKVYELVTAALTRYRRHPGDGQSRRQHDRLRPAAGRGRTPPGQ